jgi:DNA-binding XRE family transcriptional regulator
VYDHEGVNQPTEQVLKTIGRLVIDGRLELGMGQLPFAKLTKVDVKTLNSIETGRRAPRDVTQRKIEMALGWRAGSIQQVLDEGEHIKHEALTLKEMADGAGEPTWQELDTSPSHHYSGPVKRASQLTDEELLAEVSYRFRNYKDRLNGLSG